MNDIVFEDLTDVTPEDYCDRVIYSAHGIVIGRTWSTNFAPAGYAARDYTNYDSLEKLMDDIRSDFADGSLDSGFGFESLIAARMIISTRTIKIIDGKEFVNTEYDECCLGDVDLLINLEENVS